MAAFAFDFELEVDIVLFAGLHTQQQSLAFLPLEAATIGVDAVFGIDQNPMILQKPLHTVRLAAFFIGGESQDEIPPWYPAFLLQPDEIGNQKGIAPFYIGGAATVEVS